MSVPATRLPTPAAEVVSDTDRQLWKNRIQAGLAARRPYEPLWEECLAFAEGHHHITWAGPANRQLVSIRPKKGEDRVTNDELTQFRLALQAELTPDDPRPQALFRQSDAPTEDYAQQANDAIAYGWDEEWHGDQVLRDTVRTLIDVGTAPVRCRFDPDYGEQLPDEVPFLGGRMVDKPTAFQAISMGRPVQLRKVRPGRIVWEAGTPFNVIVPPRVHREQLFRWQVWVSVHDLDELKQRYPHAAPELTPDAIRSVAKVVAHGGETAAAQDGGGDTEPGPSDRQCFLYSCYEEPSRDHPQGRVVLFGCARMVPLEARPSLDYRGPDGQWRSGVHYFHAIRLSDRFWSRGFMELGLSPQRTINKRLTQISAHIDKGQAKVFVEEGALKRMPEGYPMEVVWLKPGKPQPKPDAGTPLGSWIQKNVEDNRVNLERSVLPNVALGQNPPSVDTYSQLALLRELATKRLEPLLADHRDAIVRLCEDSAWDIKRYWGAEKLVQIGGDEGELRSFTFNATVWPDYTKFMFAKGSPLPRSQGAQLKLIEELWAAAVASGAAVADPPAWMSWLYRSQQAGKPLDLPLPPGDVQREKAQYENQLLARGMPPQQAAALVDYFDSHELHIAEHRLVQAHARLIGRDDVFVACEAHVKEHERQATLNALEMAQHQAQQAPPVLPAPPGGPPGPAGGAPGSPPPPPSPGPPPPPAGPSSP